ncbi:hypothetical protein AB0D27_19130 [Streptomyces sp. NPDC048415]|uniref:hypothetical protein n=1 Tax=Streptomyces sp. NPDC048415 TaxID=3154822 RepID=UPI003447821B
MPDDDYEEDWEDDEERDIHARIHDVDTDKEIYISTVRDDDYERFVDCRVYNPSLKEYGEGVAIPLAGLHDFLKVVEDVAWQRERTGQIDHRSRVYMADDKEIDVSTIRDDGYERFVAFREYKVSLKEYGEGVTVPVGLLHDFKDGVTAAWHANGSGNWEGDLGPYMGAEGPDQ